MVRPKVTDTSAAKSSHPALERPVLHAFRVRLADWYNRNKRDLPWRHTRDPYSITVSEFMLQQTQVSTVLPYYDRWLDQFPKWKTLASAPTEKVLKAWEGLGYYQRARNLQKLAQAVAASPGGELPASIEGLQQLPGIGPYTARAIGSFAFGLKTGVLDGNVIRILTRVFAIRENVTDRNVLSQLWSLTESLAPDNDSDTYNQSIMELGALVCLPRKPACLLCPIQSVCKGKSEPDQFPVKERAATKAVVERIAVIRDGNRWWCEQSAANRRLSEFWRFPDFDSATMTEESELTRFKYTITNHRIDLTAVHARWKKSPSVKTAGRWLTRHEIESLPFSSAHRKISRQLKGDR
jgi:A/G-specific adenine glycosylase